MDWVSSGRRFPNPPDTWWEPCTATDPGATTSQWTPGRFTHRVEGGEWRDNYVFSAILTVTGSERGRSAARVTLQDEQGHKYIMFLTDTVHLLQNAKTIAYGDIDGEWTFQKRGANYGIKLVA